MVYQKSKQKPKVCHASCMKQKWSKLLLWSMLHRDMKHASSMKYVHMKHASYEAFLLHAWSMLHRSHEACFIIMKHASWDLWSMLHAWSKNASYEACFMWTYFILEACFISLWSMLHRSNLLHFCFIHEAWQTFGFCLLFWYTIRPACTNNIKLRFSN